MSDLTISEAAVRSGLSAHTLRYYERIGLLDPVARGSGNQRRYDEEDLAWLAFLQRLRATGMPIRDMRRFAALRRGGESTIAARRGLLEEHRDEVLERIAELQRDLQALTEKNRLSCPSGGESGIAFPRKRLLSLGFVVV